MPAIDLSILNQRQTPAFYADTLANRPAAGFVGRIFVSTNTFAFYRDNGTGWDLIGGPGTGTITGSGAAGQVSFWNGASTITGNNDLFWDNVNGHLGIGTNVPGTALDVHHDQSTVAILNQTVSTNDTRIGFQNNGVGLWRIGAFYNAGANDFGIYDAVSAIQPVTVKKTTGQVLIGTSTVGSGKLVVASTTGDNGIQIVGATAPSLRIDSAESGPTKRAGLGISTATNNFIQGSADRDFCMFNGSTTASPILFGIYDAGTVNVQEAARISPARNFLVGQVVDNGEKLQIGGNIYITSAGSTAGQRITLQNTTVNEIQYAFVNGGSSINNLGRLAIRNGANGTNLLQIDSAGTSYLQDINAGVSAALNTIAAVNGSGGGNRQFDLSFTGTTTGFVGEDSGDQGYGYFQVSIESGKVYQIQTTIATVNGSPITVITSSSTNFATGTVQTVEAIPVDGTSYYQFTASGAAAYIGIGFARTSGTMTATVTNFSIKQLNNTLITTNGNISTNSPFIGLGTSSKQAFLYSDTGSGYAINMAANNLGAGSTSPYGRIFFSNNVSGTLTTNALIGGYADSAADSGQLLFFTKASGGSNTQQLAIKSNGNVLIGTQIDNGNKLNVSGNIWGSALTRSDRFVSNSSFTTNIVFNTFTTFYTMTSTYGGIYLVILCLDGQNTADWAASAIIYTNGSSSTILTQQNGSLVQITTSGLDIQGKQTGTSPNLDMAYRVLKINNV